MRIVFRVDASIQIGTGHIMRCLTLAEELSNRGGEVSFICREFEGNLIERIQGLGYEVYPLSYLNTKDQTEKRGRGKLYHADWLGCTQQQDAMLCMPILERVQPHWLIVDHYAIDELWEVALNKTYQKLMVIDDLADRKHKCNVLLDQTYARSSEDYTSLVPSKCLMLLGANYALLRPEFTQWRDYSIQRRTTPKLERILITMGGVDSKNVTGKVLHALQACKLAKDIQILIVIGRMSKYLGSLKEQAETLPYNVVIKTDVTNMAELMANSDLAIGAAGATTWERCCLGLPSIHLLLADNQKEIAKSIHDAGAGVRMSIEQLEHLCDYIKQVTNNFESLISNAIRVTNGRGVLQVAEYLK